MNAIEERNDGRPKEACGVFGIFGHPEAAKLTYLGLYALQHRGQESAGIVTSDGRELHSHKGMGLVGDVFDDASLNKLKGDIAIGHVRYSTTGSSLLKNAQPLVVEYARGAIALGHNGNLVNAKILRDELEAYGSIFQTTVDSEIILHRLARCNSSSFQDNIIETLKGVEGAYSLVFLTEDQIVGVRDPHGFRPLVIGKLEGATILASETCALDLLNAEFVREVEPGEIVFINQKGIRSIKPFGKSQKEAMCIFEYVYFARPDSILFGQNVHEVRKEFGRQLAREFPVDADIVVPVPDSGNSAAMGYSQESGIPLELGIIRNHYIGRTFLQPSQLIRDFGVRIKLNPIKEILKGKRIIVVDDSIVRGTTSRSRVKGLRDAGAKEIHMRISCPPHMNPCLYGIDFPSKEELIASSKNVDEIAKFLEVDSLGYLSLEGMLKSVKRSKESFCTACYTGNYPVKFDKALNKYIMEKSSEKLLHKLK